MSALLQSLSSGHAVVIAVAAFTTLSILLDAAGKILAAWGKSAPGWFGSVSSGMASVIHFLNGNSSAAAAAVSSDAPKAA